MEGIVTFVQQNGATMLLVGVMVLMHVFGIGHGGHGRHGAPHGDHPAGDEADPAEPGSRSGGTRA